MSSLSLSAAPWTRTFLVLNLSHFVSVLRTSPIHAEAPEFTDMSVEQEILVTGIKVVDLLAPYAKGGKIGTWCGTLFLDLSGVQTRLQEPLVV